MSESQTIPSGCPFAHTSPVPTSVAGVDPSGSMTAFGAPAPSDRNSLTVGADGPTVLHDVHFVEQMAHFDRERVPERVVHAKGSGAFGTFEVTGDVRAYTKAAVFQPGTKTQMLARFSTVAGELGSPDTWRDPRGFALKFYTTEGNLDIVGNNTPIFFIRDAMKFPHFIRSQKRRPDSGLRDAQMQWDFWTLNPETAHQVTYLFGPRGIPRTLRHMNGYASHTFMWINQAGEKFWVKYHFISDQGVEPLSAQEAAQLAGTDADVHRRDLFAAIERGDYPSWTLKVQVMPYEEGKTYKINPFDVTKTLPHSDYPVIEVGRFTLTTNSSNHFAQIEQAAFDPSSLVPGTGLSPDKMLLGRIFSYADTHRHRIGANYLQLPVNRPLTHGPTYVFDGPMTLDVPTTRTPYAPNSEGRPYSDITGPVDDSWEVDGQLVRSAATVRGPEDSDYFQAHQLMRKVFTEQERQDLIANVVDSMAGITAELSERVYQYWKNIDAQVGADIERRHRA